MPKVQYTQKFRMEWLKDKLFEDWLQSKPGKDGTLCAECKFCRCTLGSRYSDLKNHCQSKKHIDAANMLSPARQKTITFPKLNTVVKSKSAEGSAALFVAEHCSFLATDHFCMVCKTMFTDSAIAKDFQMHRTKCSAKIKNVLGPHFKNELKKDVGDSPYSILIDESTDIGVLKFLGMAIIYHSKSQNKIITTFLSLTPIQQCTADAIVIAIKETILSFGLALANMKGLGTDNASVMVVVNNGVYATLKNSIPHLILVKCVCQSIQLAVSSASVGSLPRSLEFLISATYNWSLVLLLGSLNTNIYTN